MNEKPLEVKYPFPLSPTDGYVLDNWKNLMLDEGYAINVTYPEGFIVARAVEMSESQNNDTHAAA